MQLDRSHLQEYVKFGDMRPSIDTLKQFDRRTQLLPDIEAKLIHADILLDLASAEPELSTDRINFATGRLETVLHNATTQTSYDIQKMRSNAGMYVIAGLRHAELTNWTHAVQEQNVILDYNRMLHGAHRVIGYAGLGDHTVNGWFAEFTPLLLLARAQHHGLIPQVTGRLSLIREDRGQRKSGNLNGNWDLGISFDNESASFLEPKHKIQVKTNGGARKAKPYTNAGILFLDITKHHFYNSVVTVESCFAEQGNYPHSSRGLMRPAVLDRIAKNIISDINTQADSLSRSR